MEAVSTLKGAGKEELQIFIERPNVSWRFVIPSQAVPIHEQVSIIPNESLVVNMVVGSSPKADPPERLLPGMCVLTVDEQQPSTVEGTNGHVGPNVAGDDLGDNCQGQQDHEKGVQQAAIEGIEQCGIDKPVVRFVAVLVDGGVHFVLSDVHSPLEAILQEQRCCDLAPLNPSLKGEIRGGEDIEHPSDDQPASDEDEALRLGRVGLQGVPKDCGARPFTLHRGDNAKGANAVKIMIRSSNNLSKSDRK